MIEKLRKCYKYVIKCSLEHDFLLQLDSSSPLCNDKFCWRSGFESHMCTDWFLITLHRKHNGKRKGNNQASGLYSWSRVNRANCQLLVSWIINKETHKRSPKKINKIKKQEHIKQNKNEMPGTIFVAVFRR